MAHLLLDFEAVRNVETVTERSGGMKREVATGRENFDMHMIDTDRNQIVKLHVEDAKIVQEVREPTYAQSMAARKVLGFTPGQQETAVDLAKAKQERDSYRQKAVSAEVAHKRQEARIEELEKKLSMLQGKELQGGTRDMIAAALDAYILQLADTQQYDSYEKAKKVFEKVTGHGWADEGDLDDDDEEDD